MRWAGGDYGYTTIVVCQYSEAGNVIGGRGHTFDIGTPCTGCDEECDPDYFDGVLCGPSNQTSIEPLSETSSQPDSLFENDIIETIDVFEIDDPNLNLAPNATCDGVRVDLIQSDIIDVHNQYRADVSMK